MERLQHLTCTWLKDKISFSSKRGATMAKADLQNEDKPGHSCSKTLQASVTRISQNAWCTRHVTGRILCLRRAYSVTGAKGALRGLFLGK